MQFRDLKKQYEVLKKDIDQAMIDVAASSAYIMGKPVKELEAALGVPVIPVPDDGYRLVELALGMKEETWE